MEKKLLEECLKKAEAGNAVEQYRMGLFHYYGKSVTQDLKKAVYWFKQSAEQGYAYAQCNLGMCYRKGEGTLVNYMEAFKLFTVAAEQGDVSAIYNLGLCYYHGQGVAQDYVEASKLFQKVAEIGNVGESHPLDGFHAGMDKEPTSLEEAQKWFRQAKVKMDNLQTQLQNEIMKKDGHSFENDITLKKLQSVSQENEKFQKKIQELTEENNKQKQEMKRYASNVAEEKERLYKKIEDLNEQCESHKDSVSRLKKTLSELKKKDDEWNSIIGKKDATIREKTKIIEQKENEISANKISIAKSQKEIEEKNQKINNLSKQKPCIKKVNLLRWLNRLAITNFLGMMLFWAAMGVNWGEVINFYSEGGLFGSFFMIIILVSVILQRKVLKNEKYKIHGLLCIVFGIAVFLLWIFLEYEVGYVFDDFMYIDEIVVWGTIFPCILILLFNAILSMKQEIYIND